MPTQTQAINQYDIISSKNDELQNSPHMRLFEKEFERTEKQINHLEKIFKSHQAILASLIKEIENK